MSNMRLLVIGYGFHDEHINEVVAGSIKKGLSWYALYPTDFGKFKTMLHDQRYGSDLSGGLKRYWQYQLKDVFPSNQHDTGIATEIISTFTN
jgi:hypothetical protein